MSIVDSNARWADEDKAMQAYMDEQDLEEACMHCGGTINASNTTGFRTPRCEDEFTRREAEWERQLDEEQEAQRMDNLMDDFYAQVEEFDGAGKERDDIMEDQWLDSAQEDRFEVDCP